MKFNQKMNYLAILLLTSSIMYVNCQQDLQSLPDDPALKYVEQFQAALQSMFPAQSFSFDINEGEVQTIKIWPPADTDQVVITYYIHNQQNPELVTGHGFFAQCYLNDLAQRSFLNQKVGTCKIKITARPSMIDLKFKSQVSAAMTVYLNYEYKKLKIQTKSTLQKSEPTSNVPTRAQESKKKLDSVSQKFQKVRVSSQNQQTMLRTVLRGMSKHGKRLQSNIKYSQHRIITQTVVVLLSGLLGMWILKKQLNKGYQLLV